MSILKKLTAGLLSVIMIISLSACGSDTAWAAKSGEESIPAGVFLYYQMQATSEAGQQLTADQTDLFSAKIEDKDAKVWINDKVTDYLKSFASINQKYDELGLELSDDDKLQIKTSLDNFWPDQKESFEKNGISEQSINEIITNSFKEQKIYEKYYNKGGIDEVTDKQIEKCLDDNYARVKYIAIQLKDGEGNLFKSADKEKAMKMAKEYVEKAKTGGFDKIIDEYTDYYTKLVTDATGTAPTDSVSSKSTEEGDYQYETIIQKDSSVPSQKVCEKVFSMSASDTPVIVEEDEVYYVVQKLDILKRTDLLENGRDSLIYTLKGEEFTKLKEEWKNAVQLDLNEAAYKRYDPENLKQ